ncbi:BrnT family toxin [bacterium]|nr:BrnT family toxin [bacterium]
MNILWDKDKNDWLMSNRGVSFEEISDIILNEQDLIILDNPARKNQQYFVIGINNYTWVVPFIMNEDNDIVLKTAFPSRKFHKKYGENNEII